MQMSNDPERDRLVGGCMDLKDVVFKLVGPIYPVGESRADDDRFENLKSLCALVDSLVCNINKVACENKNRGEHSMNRAGKYAAKFLSDTLSFGIED
jgi:hypothetical protein